MANSPPLCVDSMEELKEIEKFSNHCLDDETRFMDEMIWWGELDIDIDENLIGF
jgi:hypothetical protein